MGLIVENNFNLLTDQLKKFGASQLALLIGLIIAIGYSWVEANNFSNILNMLDEKE